ncbi:unannotated protein [freshwater metagenome]|uniref:Cysteine--tRNA ligase n=1 Tax=freshwater metagenome TaxID=449393 RepID=A0A6J6QRN8_9ZZZZ|nr:cysteine--tRNA ligase [Actinomycetota bacterium]MSY44189.1 cysteine--tRNA ligase [Actinomycetota bacterium]
MAVKIYDTKARKKVSLTFRDEGKVSVYVCGPTVYDVPHIGHGRTAVVFDTIRRYLIWSGLEVNFVSNVTDIEDKIIARAARDGLTESEVAQEFEEKYFAELDRLVVMRPDVTPHATGYIAAMVKLISDLVASGHAYIIDDQGVYFDVSSYSAYGELSHRDLATLLESAGARVDVDSAKRSPVDFVLWKLAKPGEPSWDSPWGAGRPGWHIECSAMALDLLGDGFDLHGAGDDLVFPHNENEIAQADAAGHEFARHWIHSGMVQINAEKMSKSSGNFRSLADALDAYDPRAFRVAVLLTQYRSAMELGDSELTAAASAVDRFDSLARRAMAVEIDLSTASIDRKREQSFRAAMDDDFATPAALAVIFAAVSEANQAFDCEDIETAATLVATVKELAGVLGIVIGRIEDSSGDSRIDQLVVDRETARANRDFATADRIRDDLEAEGVVIADRASGTTWHRR